MMTKRKVITSGEHRIVPQEVDPTTQMKHLGEPGEPTVLLGSTPTETNGRIDWQKRREAQRAERNVVRKSRERMPMPRWQRRTLGALAVATGVALGTLSGILIEEATTSAPQTEETARGGDGQALAASNEAADRNKEKKQEIANFVSARFGNTKLPRYWGTVYTYDNSAEKIPSLQHTRQNPIMLSRRDLGYEPTNDARLDVQPYALVYGFPGGAADIETGAMIADIDLDVVLVNDGNSMMFVDSENTTFLSLVDGTFELSDFRASIAYEYILPQYDLGGQIVGLMQASDGSAIGRALPNTPPPTSMVSTEFVR